MSLSTFINKITVSSLIVTSALTLNIHPVISQSRNTNQVSFFCNKTFDRASETNIPATLVWIPEKKENLRIIGWKSDYFSKAISAKERCEIVSDKFQTKYQTGNLNYIILGKNNGYPILCGVKRIGDPCNGNSQLFTLKPHNDPTIIHQQLAAIMSGESSDMLMQSSGNSAYIPFSKLLEN